MQVVHDDRQFRIEDNVLKGREVSYEDEHTSLGEFVLRKLESDPDFVGQIDALTGRQYTYKQIRERSVRCALWMRSYGLRPGDVVGIFADNHIDYAMLSYATLYLGGICCSLDIIWTLKESAHRIKVSKPKLLFVDESVLADIVEAAKIADFDVKIIVFGHAPGFVSFESIIAEPGTEEVEKFVLTPINSPEKIAFLLFTSGTTGVAKGVAASHRSATLLMHQSKAIGMDGNICLTFGPIEWINMMESLMMTLLLKIPRFTLPTDFKPEIACAMIEKYKVNWSFVYAPMVHDILKSGAVSKYDLSSLKRIHYTGYLMPQSHQKAFKEHWPNVQITSGYGMTEAVGYIAIQSAESPPGSCGGIAENAEVKVIDPDTGRKLGPNQRGELLLKFACMMNSYYEDPQTTATVLDDEGWLHSGDIGYYDEAGEVFVIDRIKDRMRLADFDVCPSEIENVISTLSGVEEVACVGKPNPDGDEYAMAFVVRTEDSAGKQITEKEIIDLVAATLTPSRHLRSGVRFIDEIPRTRVGKIRRLALRDMARSS